MTKFKDLISTEEYWTTHFQTILFEAIDDYLTKTKKKKSTFAKEIGVSKGYVSQILNGDADHKISTFVKFILASGHIPELKITTIKDYLNKQETFKNNQEKMSLKNVHLEKTSLQKESSATTSIKTSTQNLSIEISYT